MHTTGSSLLPVHAWFSYGEGGRNSLYHRAPLDWMQNEKWGGRQIPGMYLDVNLGKILKLTSIWVYESLKENPTKIKD